MQKHGTPHHTRILPFPCYQRVFFLSLPTFIAPQNILAATWFPGGRLQLKKKPLLWEKLPHAASLRSVCASVVLGSRYHQSKLPQVSSNIFAMKSWSPVPHLRRDTPRNRNNLDLKSVPVIVLHLQRLHELRYPFDVASKALIIFQCWMHVVVPGEFVRFHTER